jgi:ferredoxin
VLVLLLAGNFFCTACPFMLPRDLARRLVSPRLNWPRFLRNKGAGILLFVTVLFCYELFDLWGDPWWTAMLVVLYFAAILVVDSLFKHAPFCKFVCPIGQFNFVAATVSPLEVRVRDASVCTACATKDCIRGTPPEAPRHQRGCELALFQPRKVGNLDCTFCLDCVYACPVDNIGIMARMPGDELTDPSLRSGLGRIQKRPDLAALAIVFTFGALLNAFGMVSPVYAVEQFLAGVFHTRREWPVLATLFVLLLVVEPAVLLGAAALWARRAARLRTGVLPLIGRYAFALVPFGFGVYLSHYLFHFLTGMLTFVPVAQALAQDLGVPLLGAPDWSLGGLSKASVYPLEIGFLVLGFLVSLGIAWRLAADDAPERPLRAFVPWGVLLVLLSASAVWLMTQPMEMRATLLSG